MANGKGKKRGHFVTFHHFFLYPFHIPALFSIFIFWKNNRSNNGCLNTDPDCIKRLMRSSRVRFIIRHNGVAKIYSGCLYKGSQSITQIPNYDRNNTFGVRGVRSSCGSLIQLDRYPFSTRFSRYIYSSTSRTTHPLEKREWEWRRRKKKSVQKKHSIASRTRELRFLVLVANKCIGNRKFLVTRAPRSAATKSFHFNS